MSQKLFSTLLFVLAFSSFVSAQNISIQWETPKVQDYGEQKLLLPHFKNDGFSFSQSNIFILTKQKTNGKELKISDFIWEKVNDKELYALLKYALPTENISNIRYEISNGESYANINVGLFKVENNTTFRLASFNISESGSSSYKNNAALKVGTTTNPLSGGNFYKIKVDKSGVFKITYDFLVQNGINPASVNPKNFRIYGNGGIMLPEYNQDTRYSALQENAIVVVGEEDGVWNNGDYALFYAQGPDGYNLYSQSNGNGYKRRETRVDASNGLKNVYEDFAYYFINFDKGVGKRIITEDTPATGHLISRYDEYQVLNKDEKNILKIGRVWTENESFANPKTITFNTASPILAGEAVTYRTRIVAYSAQGNNIAIDFNNLNSQSFSIPINTNADFTYFPIRYSGSTTNISGNTISFNYNPNISANPNGIFYIDYAEVQYKQELKFNGNQMNFRDFSIYSGSNQSYSFSVSNANGIEQIWDVTDITNATRKVNKSTTNSIFNFGYIASNPNFNNEFVAFRADAAYTPIFVGKIENQNLSDLQNIDYLIITSAEMMTQAQRLATYHQNTNNFTTAIVDVRKIYNEFSSGSQDATAIRDFITKLNTTPNQLKYVFILGDTSYDFRERTSGNTNIVPSYQSEQSENFISSFVTDDYFVMTKPQTVTALQLNMPDVPIGRLPAATVQEAALLIDKTLAYYNALPGQSSPFGEWRMKLDFVVDDDNDGGVPFHNIMNTSLEDVFGGTTDKPEYNIRKLYLDSFTAQNTAGGQRFPQVNQAISNDVGNSLYLFYFGHGGINGWAQERVLSTTEVQNFFNYSNVYSRFPLVSTITCEFTLWDEPLTNSVGEQVIKHKKGGATTMITSSRALAVVYGIGFTKKFTEEIFKLYNDDFETLGNSFLKSKQTYTGPGGNDFVKVNYLGDPAMKLSRPQKNLVIDQIETPVPGLIRALDFVKITGHINNPNGTLNTAFNGRVAINIFDKKLDKQTLNNDGHLTPVLHYKEEGSAIVKASGQVQNGLFTVEFYVPNDINYTIGDGRILAYADNKKIDVFNNQNYSVGDINPNGLNDNEPPKVKLYMNNTNFANGGITNQNPMLLACITDDTGINSTGAGIGHDITTYLDGEIINTVILNDFYASGDGNGCLNPSLQDYQKGNVAYPFRNLMPGEHLLTFKVWDINNNSTTETLKFIVKDEAEQKLIINRPLNWPNPFTNKTYIQFEHNCDDILDVNVQIYTITGKLVKTISTTVIAEPFLQGYRTPKQAIEWDGKDDFGDTVGKGTYIFKIFARSQNQEKCKGGATALEKMVLLK